MAPELLILLGLLAALLVVTAVVVRRISQYGADLNMMPAAA